MFAHPRPSSHTKTSRNYAIRHCSHHHHLPRMEQRAGGEFLRDFDTVHITTTSLTCNSEPEVVLYTVSTPFATPPPQPKVDLWYFDAVRTFSSSLACNSKPEVGFYGVRVTITSLACNSELEVGFHAVLTLFASPPPQAKVDLLRPTLFAPPPPLSHVTASRRWFLRCFNTVHATTTLAYKSELEVVFLGCFESHKAREPLAILHVNWFHICFHIILLYVLRTWCRFCEPVE
jgi:hypothetical protein